MATERKGNFGAVLLLIFLASIAGYLVFKTFGKSSIDTREKTTNLSPGIEKVKIKFRPADFQVNIDEDIALQILEDPTTHKKEFYDLVNAVNTQILSHIGRRMSLTGKDQERLLNEYANQRDIIVGQVYRDYLQAVDTTGTIYQMWYKNQDSHAVKAFDEVMSRYACFMATNAIAKILPNASGDYAALGKSSDHPCGIIGRETLRPLLGSLEQRAAIRDFSASKGMLEQKVEKEIAELAVLEIRDKKAMDKTLTTTWLGIDVSSTEVEVAAYSNAKIGYKLDRKFDIELDPKRKVLKVTLPEPEILSHEIYPRIDRLDIGWLKNVKSDDLNEYMNILRMEFRKDIQGSDAYFKAKDRAEDVMDLIIGPILPSLGKGYKMEVFFYKYDIKEYEDLMEQIDTAP